LYHWLALPRFGRENSIRARPHSQRPASAVAAGGTPTSVAVDVDITQLVDGRVGVHAICPKMSEKQFSARSSRSAPTGAWHLKRLSVGLALVDKSTKSDIKGFPKNTPEQFSRRCPTFCSQRHPSMLRIVYNGSQPGLSGSGYVAFKVEMSIMR
jgi:hypothetical protein